MNPTLWLLGRLSGGLLLAAGWAGWARAVDGVIEISQERVLAGSISPGDLPGFPITIAKGGSYRLTGNLVVPVKDARGFHILADDVSLDLNGFSIRCEKVSSGETLACRSTGRDGTTGAGIGIVIEGRNARISNGTVRHFGSGGVYAMQVGSSYILDRVSVHDNFGYGLESRGDGQVLACNFRDNTGYGIVGAAHSLTVLDTMTESNSMGGLIDQGAGIRLGTSAFDDGITAVAVTLLTCVADGITSRCP